MFRFILAIWKKNYNKNKEEKVASGLPFPMYWLPKGQYQSKYSSGKSLRKSKVRRQKFNVVLFPLNILLFLWSFDLYHFLCIDIQEVNIKIKRLDTNMVLFSVYVVYVNYPVHCFQSFHDSIHCLIFSFKPATAFETIFETAHTDL